jgi:hypothetical protein
VTASLLFGVGPADPQTFAAVAVLLVAVAAMASAMPAYRATRVDPVRTDRRSASGRRTATGCRPSLPGPHYSNATGAFWAAGSNVLATRLR